MFLSSALLCPLQPNEAHECFNLQILQRSAELLDKSFIPGEYHIAKTCHCCVTGITLSRNESPFLMLL